MSTEYLEQSFYTHPEAMITRLDAPNHGAINLYGIASFLVTCGYLAHRESGDNGESPRSRTRGLLGEWLTPEKERQLYLSHVATLRAVTEEIANRLYQTI